MRLLPLLLVAPLTACSTMSSITQSVTDAVVAGVQAPLNWVGLGPDEAAIDAEELLAHTKILSSDRFEGRAPGSLGEELTVAYLTEQFKDMGLKPGNPDGSYVQNVPLVGLAAQQDVGLQVNGKPVSMKLHDDVMFSSPRVDPLVRVRQSPIVFVGYGVQAPEYNWDDFKGQNLRGKTLLFLVNDPQIERADQPGQLDDSLFRGKAMTYYGRWTYKHEIAAKLGAAAVLVIHETGPAGYPWAVVSGGGHNERFTLDTRGGNRDQSAIQGWINEQKTREILKLSGLDFDELKQAALQRDFQPVALPAQASFQVRNKIRRFNSQNVVALVPGTEQPDEHIVFTAHWDHMGKDPSRNGDQIYNGALDNATGVAGLLELAEVFAATPAQRSALFLAVTAEEQGLLGARYYAKYPLYPLTNTVANINMDTLNQWGKTEDIIVVGKGQNSLEDVLAEEAAKQGRVTRPEAEPEKGFYFRSDHFEFAKRGVPALYAGKGTRYVGKDAEYGMQKRREYVTQDYHKVSDEIKPDWDLSGAVQDLELLEALARNVAGNPQRPYWKAGSEFSRPEAKRHP